MAQITSDCSSITAVHISKFIINKLPQKFAVELWGSGTPDSAETKKFDQRAKLLNIRDAEVFFI